MSCTSQQVSTDNPDALYKQADEDFKDERYLTAMEKYRDIKNRFPYSNRAVDAELRMADTYFAQESYIEAESAYEIFRELHPTHPKSDYVQYQVALSAYDQIPENTARDLSAAHKAIESFQTLIDKFPSSEFVAKAKELVTDCRKKLAEHEYYVAEFYFNREHFLAASYRYAALLKEFPNLGYDENALFRLAKCYFNVRMYSNAKDTLRKLIASYPATLYKNESQNLLEELTKKN